MPNQQITHAELVAILDYDQETGQVAWRTSAPGRRARVGEVRKGGRVRVSIGGLQYQLSRLCWFHAHGTWPLHVIDHINGNPGDNRLANLRDIPQALNAQNQRNFQRKPKTGARGVVNGVSGGFRASIHFQGKKVYASPFASAEEAHAFYLELKRRLHDGAVLA